MRVVNLVQGSDEWLQWRSQGITATDGVILSGRSPYKTRWRLWAEKTGYARPVDLSLNPLVRKGKENEHKARLATERLMDDILTPMCVESSVDPLIRASLDGLNSLKQPAELKCPSEKVWIDVCTNGTSSLAYKMYYAQVQHQLLATGSNVGHLVFYFEGQLKHFVIHADKAMLSALYPAAKQLWHLVVNRIEPPKDAKRDLYIPQGEQATQWISEAEQYRFFEGEIQALKLKLKDYEAKQKPHLDSLKSLMGEYFHADYCGLMVTRYNVSGKVDYDKLLADKAKNITIDDLDLYRGQKSDRYRVTVSDSVMPRHIADAEVLAPLDDADKDYQPLYF
ncbi:YqaJ viral recombinase family nuclease [Eoetvoesiella caeni]